MRTNFWAGLKNKKKAGVHLLAVQKKDGIIPNISLQRIFP